MLNPVTNIAKGGIHMEARAVLRYARISPRKVKIVLDLIRNKPANVAMGILNNSKGVFDKASCVSDCKRREQS